jgi:hypothetical protein
MAWKGETFVTKNGEDTEPMAGSVPVGREA